MDEGMVNFSHVKLPAN